MKLRGSLCLAATLFLAFGGNLTVSGQSTDAKKKIQPALSDSVAKEIAWRSIGPANMSGRITAITVYEADTNIWWAASASGGLLKTVNNGNDFEHQFTDQATVSIGDVQVAQSDPEIVWVGTGESNPRNSVSWGDGVYKSTDGGKTWKNMGLKKIFQTGALAIHPTNPDIVWVGALGRLWGPNPERGLYKTVDGGKTWKQVLFVDDKTGVVDVQVNPKNPDEMLVATYERKRDGFDGNDPEQRFGEGAGIYKSTDGGETFERMTQGLPTCKMGRIGIDYFVADPNFVYAVIETEKIGTEPDKFPFAGFAGSDADVGAKITQVTSKGPAETAGLKVDDIVVSVNDRIVASYSEMLEEIQRSRAGDKVKLVVSRDRKLTDITLELVEKPKNSRGQNPFTGTLGGQASNKQDIQGPEGFEYGGIYRSEDGGSTWTRINSLNPRPMYYSNIQVDPVDRNYLYLCGTSLYKSSDGGKTFTGDGGSDGIHVDHHALWLNPHDPRNMILGNDGGIHVTFDRMQHWDHHNHVAIGQFYHVGLDTNRDYMVYGGLQDNGSWGGPSRNGNEGIVNSDWIRVGGGDGFVTLVDPNDPNQIYFESQNGGMGRIHLETGERGFIRPRERGIQFRFNWKTPYLLSPHNSKIHYSAGNYVLRSLNRGDNIKRISPEITNTKQGAASALSESPMEEGLLYVGTTDGAVWMTRDGGQKWEPLFFTPQANSKEAKPEEQEGDEGGGEGAAGEVSRDEPAAEMPADEPASGEKTADEPAGADKPADEPVKEAISGDPVTGTWTARMISDRIPAERAEFKVMLKLDGKTVTGEITGRRANQEISEGTFDPETGKISWAIAGGRGSRQYSGTIENNKMTGEMTFGEGRDPVPFEAEKGKSSTNAMFSIPTSGLAISTLMLTADAPQDDPISGTWTGTIQNENLPNGEIAVEIELSMNPKNVVTGTITSSQGEVPIVEGVYNPESKRLIIVAERDELTLDITGDVTENKMNCEMLVNDGQLEMEFSLARSKPTAGSSDSPATESASEAKPAEAKEQEPKAEAKPDEAAMKPAAEAKEQEPKAEAKPAAEAKEQEPKAEAKPAADDPISGTWTGTMTSPQGERDMTVILKRKDNQTITGTFESPQGDREITSGTFDPESKALNLVAASDQFDVEFKGTLADQKYTGSAEFAGGRFTMDFALARTAKTTGAAEPADKKVAEPLKEGPTGQGSLAAQVPGPRWVSSLEASRFKAGRCYIGLDGHRSNDDGVYAFVTEDYGKTWKSLTTNLPASAGSVRVLREDLVNENLLYLGCEFSAWWSIDRGVTWTRIGGLPTVAVHEFAIHPTTGEVVAATHGRSLWIADVSILRQLTPKSLAESARLYDVATVIRGQRNPERGDSGTRRFVGENPGTGVSVAYSLAANARSVTLRVVDLDGETVKEFEDPSSQAGVHLYQWDLRQSGGGGGRGPGGGGRGGRGRFGGTVPVGTYRLELRVDGQLHSTLLKIETDPKLSAAARAQLEQQSELEALEMFWEAGVDD